MKNRYYKINSAHILGEERFNNEIYPVKLNDFDGIPPYMIVIKNKNKYYEALTKTLLVDRDSYLNLLGSGIYYYKEWYWDDEKKIILEGKDIFSPVNAMEIGEIFSIYNEASIKEIIRIFDLFVENSFSIMQERRKNRSIEIEQILIDNKEKEELGNIFIKKYIKKRQ